MSRILITDDDQSFRETLAMFLQRLGHETLEARQGREGLRLFRDWSPDLTLLDIRMPEMDGMSVLDEIHRATPCHPVILVSALDDVEDIMAGMQRGAFEFIEKPVEMERLERVVRRALNERAASMRTVPLADNQNGDACGESIVGRTAAMRNIFQQMGRVSRNRVSVLIQGESGTGKELIARLIHCHGPMQEEPFIPVNCSAIPEPLIESELFGHVRGSFTDAFRDRKGKFELAGKGTIFLDEISELSLCVQSKFLRVLQEREFEPVGGERALPMQARIIAASNQDLEAMVERKKFREDLYYRLNVVRINVPPLRERMGDLHALILHFLRRSNRETGKNVTKVAYDAVELLESYPWPGNVRELENVILQAVVNSNGDILERHQFQLRQCSAGGGEPNGIGSRDSLCELERRHIARILEENNWNKTKCSELLGITRPTLAAKIREYGLVRAHPR